jgi:ATP-binding cassette subfamily C protein CydD
MFIDRHLIAFAKLTRRPFILAVLLGSLGGILTITQAFFLSRILTLAFIDNYSLRQLQTQIIGLIAASLLRAVMQYFSQTESSRAAGKIKSWLRRHVFSQLIRLGPQFSAGQHSGELSNTMLSGIESLEAYFSQYLPQLILSVVIPLLIFLTVLPIDLLSGFVLLFTAPIIPVFMMLIGHLAQGITRRQWESLSRLSAYYLDALQGLTTLKIFGRSKTEANRIAEIGEEFRKTTMNVLRVAFLSALTLEMAATISAAVIAVEIGLRLMYGRLEFEQALFILIITPEFYQPLRALGARFHAGMEGLNAARRLFQIFDTPQTAAVIVESQKSTPMNFSIRFENLGFRYSTQTADALRDISFTLHHGQKTALVGASASGKSTIIQLLLKFISPESGKILISGQDLSEWNREDWLRHISWLPQKPYLFYGTVLENLLLANPQADSEMIALAVEKAHLTEVIDALPQGLHTMIGEQAMQLSSGQAQRLALARAFLKNSPILIMDEATSSLDVQTEAVISEAVDRMTSSHCTLISAHRLRTIRNAGQIILLSAGRIIATGDHSELLKSEAYYAAMFGNAAEAAQ